MIILCSAWVCGVCVCGVCVCGVCVCVVCVCGVRRVVVRCVDKAVSFPLWSPSSNTHPSPPRRERKGSGRQQQHMGAVAAGGWQRRPGGTSVLLYLVRAAPRDKGKSVHEWGGNGTFPQSISTGARPTHLISIAPHLNPHSAHCPAPSSAQRPRKSPPSRVVDPDCCSPPLHVQRPAMVKSAPDRNRKHTKPWAPATACWFLRGSAHTCHSATCISYPPQPGFQISDFRSARFRLLHALCDTQTSPGPRNPRTFAIQPHSRRTAGHHTSRESASRLRAARFSTPSSISRPLASRVFIIPASPTAPAAAAALAFVTARFCTACPCPHGPDVLRGQAAGGYRRPCERDPLWKRVSWNTDTGWFAPSPPWISPLRPPARVLTFANPAEVGFQPPTASNAPASDPKSTSRRRTENGPPWLPH